MNRQGFLLMVILLFSPALSVAQFSPQYGIKLGVVAATQSWDYPNLISTDPRWGFDVGGSVEPFRSSPLSFLAELHYIQKGTKYVANVTIRANNEQGFEEKEITYRPRLDYLSFAVYGKFLLDASSMKPYVFAGPRVDYIVGKQEDGILRLYDNFQDTDVGATFGAGLEIPATMLSGVLVEFRFSPSFTVGYQTNTRTVKNKSFELLLGVIL
jgi:hypothetical protein